MNTWDLILEKLAMIWKPVAAVVMLVAAAGSTAGLWLHFNKRSDEQRLPGTVETQEVRLSSRVGGRVAKVLVSESQLVEPGQVIVELEMPELDAQRGQLVAQKEAAEAILARLEHGPREEEKAAAKAAVDTAAAKLAMMQRGYREEEKEQARQEQQALEAELQNAQQDLNRERSLLAKGASTLQAYDAAFSRYHKLLAQVNAASAKVKMLETGYRPEEVAEAKADVARLQANYDL